MMLYPIGCDTEMLLACGAEGACFRGVREASREGGSTTSYFGSVKRVPWWEQHCLSLFRPVPSTTVAFTFSVRTSWTPEPRESTCQVHRGIPTSDNFFTQLSQVGKLFVTISGVSTPKNKDELKSGLEIMKYLDRHLFCSSGTIFLCVWWN